MKGHTPMPDEHIVHTGIVILASAVEDLANLALGEGSADQAKDRLRESRAALRDLFFPEE
jgi:hypothetical protein